MKKLRSWLQELSGKRAPTVESVSQKPSAREAFDAEMKSVEEKWRSLMGDAEEALKVGNAEDALRQYHEAFEMCRNREEKMREAGHHRQMNKLYGLVLGKAKSLSHLGRKMEALRELFLLFDLSASSDIEGSRFLYEGRGKSLTKKEHEADVRDAYKTATASGIVEMIAEIARELKLSSEDCRREYENMVSAYHSQLSLEADTEKVWKAYLASKRKSM